MPMGYEDVADEIRARIERGELPPGAKVPSETEVRTTYGVSRDTASRALRLLREEGLTEARQGAATRVRRYQPIRRSAGKRLAASVWGAGVSMWEIDVLDTSPQVRDVEVSRIEASRRVAAALDVKPGSAVIKRTRRYFVGEKPVMHATSLLPADIADGTPISEIDTGPGGIYARLADLGHAPAEFDEDVRARMPTRPERHLLTLDWGTPLVVVVRTATTAAGRIVEVNEMLLDASRYLLSYNIKA